MQNKSQWDVNIQPLESLNRTLAVLTVGKDEEKLEALGFYFVGFNLLLYMYVCRVHGIMYEYLHMCKCMFPCMCIQRGHSVSLNPSSSCLLKQDPLPKPEFVILATLVPPFAFY